MEEKMHNNLVNCKVNDAPTSVGTIFCFIDCGLFSAVGSVICSARRQMEKNESFLLSLPDKTEGDI